MSESLEITNWSPEVNNLTDTSSISIMVSFSVNPVKTSVEEAFSLTTEGVEIPGTYNWLNGSTMEFNLLHNLELGHDYILKVSTQAEDSLGNSLDEDFIHLFTTKRTLNRPILLDQFPNDFSTIDDKYQGIVFTFDKAMNTESIVKNFTISPSIAGYFTWSSNKQIFTFNPAEPFTWQEDYVVSLASETRDDDGWTLGYEHVSNFHLGLDQTPPDIIQVSDETEANIISREDPDDPLITITQDWEKDRNIVIQFSEAMNQQSVENSLSIEPQCSWTNQWSSTAQGDQLLIEWKEALEYDTTYSLKISDSAKDFYDNSFADNQTYHFQANGLSSKPPEIQRLVYIKESGIAPLRQEILYDRNSPVENDEEFIFSNTDELVDGSPLNVYFDFYFDIADNAHINQFSFMENFAILPQNGALTFTSTKIIAKIDTNTPSYTGTPPDFIDGYLIVRVEGKIVDPDSAVGMVEFKVYKDFEDTLGNKMTKDWYWRVFDIDL